MQSKDIPPPTISSSGPYFVSEVAVMKPAEKEDKEKKGVIEKMESMHRSYIC